MVSRVPKILRSIKAGCWCCISCRGKIREKRRGTDKEKKKKSEG